MTKRLVLARHAQVDPRYAGCFLGSTDLPLSDLGARQAAALSRSLQETEFDSLSVSPLRRTVETAKFFNPPWKIDSDLREIDFGNWEGRSFDEISASGHDEQIDRWRSFDPHFSFPNGESIGAFVARVSRVADRLATGSGESSLAITHGGVIRVMICHLLGLEPKNYLLFDVKPASITTIDLFDGKGVLAGLSDMCHLEGIR